MTMTKNLLVELFVEELPPKSLKKLGDSFASNLLKELDECGLTEQGSKATAFASPRRLAAHITNVRSSTPVVSRRKKLMPEKIGCNPDGSWSEALLKKLEKDGVPYAKIEMGLARLEIGTENGSTYVYLSDEVGGESLKDILGIRINAAQIRLPIPKVMTYQLEDGWTTMNFVRPVHRLVVLHGAEVVLVSALYLQAGRTTQGHRFEAASSTLEIRNADSYEAQMENEGAVIPSFEKRRSEIAKQLAAAAAKEKLTPVADDALLDEVTALVERPNVLVGKFEKEFLEVPQECLILTMKANQKYFPLLDIKGKLTNRFLIVSNIRPADPSLVIGGNERVVRPRLADAKFFYDQDRKKTLESRVLGLAKVVYHNKLGTQGDRVQRVCVIAKGLGKQLGGEVLALKAEQAALLAKADLLTDMVGEFPELQGIMGRYYAQHDGLSDEIAYAIEDHYKPRFAGDELPRNMVGVCVALADKLETLLGMFGIGEIPTGDQDRFALRRHALGVIRMLIEKELPLELEGIINIASEIFGDLIWVSGVHPSIKPKGSFAEGSMGVAINSNVADLVSDFIYERLAGMLKEQGYSAQEVDAVLSLRPQRLIEVMKRLAAVRAFAALPEAAALAAANKRVGNILKKEGITTVDAVNSKLLKEPAEQALYQALGRIAPKADAAFKAGDYTGSLQALAALRVPVDDFFDNVMVNAEDAALRANRLALLSQLHLAMNRVADISKLAA